MTEDHELHEVRIIQRFKEMIEDLKDTPNSSVFSKNITNLQISNIFDRFQNPIEIDQGIIPSIRPFELGKKYRVNEYISGKQIYVVKQEIPEDNTDDEDVLSTDGKIGSPTWMDHDQGRHRCIPAVFYGYGSSNINNRIPKSTNEQGETLRIILYLVIDDYDLERNNDKDSEQYGWFRFCATCNPNGRKHLLEKTAEAHSAIKKLLLAHQNLGDIGDGCRTDRVYLESMSSYEGKLADREFLQFVIAIDYIYPIT